MDWPTSFYFAGFASLIGAGFGLAGLFTPRLAARLTHLVPDPAKSGGRAELRGNYGGGFFFLHAAVLLTIAMSAQAGTASVIGASFAAALFWIGIGLGRAITLIAEPQTRSAYMMGGVAFEFVLGAMLLMPFLGHLG